MAYDPFANIPEQDPYANEVGSQPYDAFSYEDTGEGVADCSEWEARATEAEGMVQQWADSYQQLQQESDQAIADAEERYNQEATARVQEAAQHQQELDDMQMQHDNDLITWESEYNRIAQQLYELQQGSPEGAFEEVDQGPDENDAIIAELQAENAELQAEVANSRSGWSSWQDTYGYNQPEPASGPSLPTFGGEAPPISNPSGGAPGFGGAVGMYDRYANQDPTYDVRSPGGFTSGVQGLSQNPDGTISVGGQNYPAPSINPDGSVSMDPDLVDRDPEGAAILAQQMLEQAKLDLEYARLASGERNSANAASATRDAARTNAEAAARNAERASQDRAADREAAQLRTSAEIQAKKDELALREREIASRMQQGNADLALRRELEMLRIEQQKLDRELKEKQFAEDLALRKYGTARASGGGRFRR